jgi:3-isopropylmalate dehydrogenase
MRYSRDEVVRVARVAFRAAQERRGRLTSVDKANVLETSQLWRRVVSDLAAEYAGVQVEHLYVDACAMMLALDPKRFDVIVTENLFGDILSDEAGALAGSLGLLPSASLGDGPAVYEPVHGSAPTLAGKDMANPTGAIASAAMLLRHSLGQDAAARAIERAITETIAAGVRTADIAAPGAPVSSGSAFARAVVERIRDN